MRRLAFIMLVIVPLTLLACSPKPTATEDPDATPASGVQPTPLPPPAPGKGLSVLAGQIMKHPKWYDGQMVTLVGYFRGQDLLDEVILDPPTNRSRDWVVKDDTGAIYVSYQGSLPFPSTVHEVWRIVRVYGQVKVHASGMPYVVPSTVEWEGLKENYDVLPAACILAIHRFGGTEELDHHIYWYSSRNVVVYDAKTKWRGAVKLKAGQTYDWERAFKKARFFDLPATVGQACQGCVRYYIAAVDEKKGEPHFVTLYEGSVPDKLQAFIDTAIEKTGEAKEMNR